MENMKVKNAVISKQTEDSSNFQEFLKIANEKNINLLLIEKGSQINIENDLFFLILWPDNNNLINENPLNNNSIVCKLYYKNFTALFTGDVEEIAENQILKIYKNNPEILKSQVLKIAHHGSKSSSSQDLIQKILPKICLIGVGKNNLYGHPNEGVIERLKEHRRFNLQNR